MPIATDPVAAECERQEAEEVMRGEYPGLPCVRYGGSPGLTPSWMEIAGIRRAHAAKCRKLIADYDSAINLMLSLDGQCWCMNGHPVCHACKVKAAKIVVDKARAEFAATEGV